MSHLPPAHITTWELIYRSDNQSSILRELHELKEKNSLLEYTHSKKLEEVSSSLREISGKPLEKPVLKESSKVNVSLDGFEILNGAFPLQNEILESENSPKASKPVNRSAGKSGPKAKPKIPFLNDSDGNDNELIFSWEHPSDSEDETYPSDSSALSDPSHISRLSATARQEGDLTSMAMPVDVLPEDQESLAGDRNSKLGLAKKINDKPSLEKKLDLKGIGYLAEKLPLLVSMASQIAAEQVILSSLHFRSMTVRHESIADAYVDTFNWIFRSPKKVAKRGIKVYFLDWLEAQDGIYWVSGKPGSGKSTLMKFLCDHVRTQEALSLWAYPWKCIISSHFFWSVGTPMQKSQEGLLRSLLYDIFKQSPMVVEEVCPDRWAAAHQGRRDNELWTLSELRKAIKRLAACRNLGIKFCFFIDGLDEYDGDHAEVIRILGTLSTSPHIKLCLSSRPWNVFEDTYGRNPKRKLYLQDLTRNDIKCYVKAKLEEHLNWDLLPSEDTRYKDIVKEVTKKAEGVFLWVFLVIRSLQEGLTNGDTLADLQRRIRTLPADLEEFFKHMLDSVDSFYHDRMVQTFRVAMCSPIPLALMIYSFLDEGFEDEKFALNAPFRQMPDHVIELRHEQMRRRLNGRCKGLLEVYRNPSLDPYYLGHQVDFLHRTVRDFLRTKEMSDYLTTDDIICGPNTSILRAYVVLIKCVPLQRAHFEDGGTLSKMLMDAFHFARQAELESGQPQTELLDDLHDNLRIFTAASGRKIPWYRKCYDASYCNRENSYPACGSFLEFSIQKGLALYVKEKLRLGAQSLGSTTPLLDCALRMCPSHTTGQPDLTDVVRVLLDQGFDPNQTIGDSTVWGVFLHLYAQELENTRDSDDGHTLALHHHHLIELLVSRGADPNVVSPGLDASGSDPAWGRLLLAASRRNLSRHTASVYPNTIEAFLLAGADPNFRNGQWRSKSIWKQFVQHVEGLSESSAEVVELEFFAKVTCLMLLHGADPTTLSRQVVKNKFPPRFSERILETLDEKSQAQYQNGSRNKRDLWSFWSWFYSWST